MAAIAIAQGMGVPMNTILDVVRDFRAVEHRIELWPQRRQWILQRLQGDQSRRGRPGDPGLRKPTILIGGGYDKGSDYDEWIESFEDKVKCLVLIGQTKEKIAECARRHGFERIRFADTFEECLKLCTELAQSGDAVLLSPACASWGNVPEL